MAQSDIVLDGSTGAGVGATQNFSVVPGQNQTIILEGNGPDRHGTINGSNLLFSFDRFGIAPGDTAQFQCTGCGGLQNVISRVTGSNSSVIDGTLKSVVPNAAFWFFNPNGVILGQNSVIDVPAGLHISTGNAVNFGTVSFTTGSDPNASSLSLASPESFGFAATGNITVSGTHITAGNGPVELAAAKDVTISHSNVITTPGAVTISAGNGAGTASSLSVADNAVVNVIDGSLTQRSAGTLLVGRGAFVNGQAEAGTDLSNSGVINGQTRAGNDLTNTGSGVINAGAQASNNLLNSGMIYGGTIQAGTDLVNTGAIRLNQAGAAQVIAGQDLINRGDGINTGVIVINHQVGTEAIIAGRNLVLGQNAEAGRIQKISGNDDLVISSGTAGSFQVNNSGSGISDSSSGSGKLAVVVPAGDLVLPNGTGIAKSGLGIGALTVQIDAGNINVAAGSSIVAGQNSTANAIKASGAIDNRGQLTADSVTAGDSLQNHLGATITGNVNANNNVTNSGSVDGNSSAANNLNNYGSITGNAQAGQQLFNTGLIQKNATADQGELLNIGTIEGNAQATQGVLTNSKTILGSAKAGTTLNNQVAGTIALNAEAGTELINTGIISGNATANNLTNSATIDGSAIAVNNLSNTGLIRQSATAQNGTLQNNGTIRGNAEATYGALINANTINGRAKAGNSLENQDNAAIGAGAQAGGALSNRGVITGQVDGGSIHNFASINGTAAAVTNLVNTGTITQAATVQSGTLNNGGSIGGNATVAVGTLINSGRIAGQAKSSGSLENQPDGTLENGADTQGQLINQGTIDGTVNAATATNTATINGSIITEKGLINTGQIRQNAVSQTGNLENYGDIKGNANALQGNLINTKTIAGQAVAGTDLQNRVNATIGNGAQAGRDLFNNGIIQGANVQAGRDLSNIGTTAQIKINQTALSNQLSAGRDLLVDQGAEIVVEHPGTTQIMAGNHLQLGRDGVGTITKTGTGSGDVQIISTGESGGISLNNPGSKIVDQSSGGGALHVESRNDLTLNNATRISKQDAGQLTVLTAQGAIKLLPNALVSHVRSHPDDQLKAGTSLQNDGAIRVGSVQATTGLLNNGNIYGNAETLAGNLTNTGTVEGTAKAWVDLVNSGIITGASAANRNLNNSGKLTHDAYTVTGNLTNSGVIDGTARSGQDLVNTADGTISNGAEAGRNLTNYGTIQGTAVHAGNHLLNTGSKAVITLTGPEDVALTAAGDLTLAEGSRVVAANDGAAFVLAGKNLTITDQNTQVSLNNQTGKSIVAAGAALANTNVQASGSGGNLHLDNGGKLEKTVGTGDLIMSAYKQPGTSPRQKSVGGQIIMEGKGTAVNVSHQGNLGVIAEATASQNSVDGNGLFINSSPALYALRIANGAAINLSNRSALQVQAQTVYLQGNAIKSDAGDITFAGTSGSNSGAPQQFKMQGATIKTGGIVTLQKYYLDMQSDTSSSGTTIPSGIKADTQLNLQVRNLQQLGFPLIFIGNQAQQKGQNLAINYFDTPSLNGQTTTTPDANEVVKTSALAVLAKQSEVPSLPKNPCDRQPGQSNFNVHSTGLYVPQPGAQLPYSMLAVTANAPTAAHATGVNLAGNPATNATNATEAADDCRHPK